MAHKFQKNKVQEKYSELVKKEFSDEFVHNDLTSINKILFSNPRSLKLSYSGYFYLQKIYDMFEVKINENSLRIKPKYILALNKHCQMPYYMDKKKVCFCTNEDALEFAMVSGDFEIFSEFKNYS